jgi:hypothetical protein
MGHVSRPLLALLAATVLGFAVWLVALKGGGSSNPSTPGNALGQYQSAVNAAHQAVTTANAAGASAAGTPDASGAPAASSTPSSATAPVTTTSTHAPGATAAGTSSRVVDKPAHGTVKRDPAARGSAGRVAAVEAAVRRHKVLALLFYNPAAPDDRAVARELGTVSTHGGKVFKLAIPLAEINGYAGLLAEVPVNFSPTLVLVAPNGQSDEIVGYADPFEISQRVDDVVSAR